MVTGLGPVGLGGIINARYRGARVIGVESHPYRAELAKKLGADIVLNPNDEDILDQIHDFTDGIGVDKALDCSGASAAHRLMVDAARRKGQVTFIGEGGDFPLGASRDMIRKGLVLRGNWHLQPRCLSKIDEGDPRFNRTDRYVYHSHVPDA